MINQFCFASESCIPITTIEECLNQCYGNSDNTTNNNDDGNNDGGSGSGGGQHGSCGKSVMSYSALPNNGYAKQLQVR